MNFQPQKERIMILNPSEVLLHHRMVNVLMMMIVVLKTVTHTNASITNVLKCLDSARVIVTAPWIQNVLKEIAFLSTL